MAEEKEVPGKLWLASILSSGITGIASVSYIILSALGLIYRNKCIQPTDARNNFWLLIYQCYIQDKSCGEFNVGVDLTKPHDVYVFMLITLSISLITLITSSVVFICINFKEMNKYINVYVYAYVISWVSSLVVDLTLAVYLGMDYSNLTVSLVGQYYVLTDFVRQGTVFLMAIALKGYLLHIINCVLIIMMVVYLYNFQNDTQQKEHSIHKTGAIFAFEQVNHAYMGEEAMSPYNLRQNSFRRSDSWHHQPRTDLIHAPVNSGNPAASGNMPFSYLEDNRSTMQMKPPVPEKPQPPKAQNNNWRGWSAQPPVPAPDYSPRNPRKLKSALKTQYI